MKNQKRYSFTLLELLISIIVLSIIMSTIPIFLNTSIFSSKVGARESVFFNEFSLLSLINMKYFDENNTVRDNFYKELNSSGDSELEILVFNDGFYRLGKKEMNNNKFRSGTNWTVSNIGIDKEENISDITTFDDIDDFNGYGEHVNVGVVGGYDINVSVGYIMDETNYSASEIVFDMNYTFLKSNSNIKLIKVYSRINGDLIEIEYPTCNIGASKIYSLEEIK